jgi:SAM-dependent methyltransferase
VWDPPVPGSSQWYQTSDLYATTPFIDWLGWPHQVALAEVAPARTLLDIGCADGRFVYAAASRGIDAIGIDHSDLLVRSGNERHNGDRLSTTSIEQFRTSGRTFDAVTLFDVIEHVPSPLDLLRLVMSVTRPGGVVVVSTPNRLGYPWGHHPMDRPPHHLTRWTPSALRVAFGRAGLAEPEFLFSPGDVGLRSFLLDHVQLGLVRRLLRRRAGAPSRDGAPGGSSEVRSLVHAKDKAVRMAAGVLAPVFGRRFAGGAMVASATRPG